MSKKAKKNKKNKKKKKSIKEKYPFVYVRKWDLMKYDEKLLEGYGLEKKIYVYVGSCNDYSMNSKNSKFRYAINHGYHSKELRKFIKTLELFYSIEFNYNKKYIDKLVYCSSKIAARVEGKKRKSRLKIERAIAGHYKFLEQFNEIADKSYKLMSEKDCCYEEYYKEGISILHYKGC